MWPYSKRIVRNRPYSVNPRATRTDKPRPAPKGHYLCPICRRLYVARNAARCFRCADLSPAMAELNEALNRGQTAPRRTLAELAESERAVVSKDTADPAELP